MICPHGPHELAVPENARRHVLIYGDSALVVTECCRRMVRLRSHQSFSVHHPSKYDLEMGEDDWGTRPDPRWMRP